MIIFASNLNETDMIMTEKERIEAEKRAAQLRKEGLSWFDIYDESFNYTNSMLSSHLSEEIHW